MITLKIPVAFYSQESVEVQLPLEDDLLNELKELAKHCEIHTRGTLKEFIINFLRECDSTDAEIYKILAKYEDWQQPEVEIYDIDIVNLEEIISKYEYLISPMPEVSCCTECGKPLNNKI